MIAQVIPTSFYDETSPLPSGDTELQVRDRGYLLGAMGGALGGILAFQSFDMRPEFLAALNISTMLGVGYLVGKISGMVHGILYSKN